MIIQVFFDYTYSKGKWRKNIIAGMRFVIPFEEALLYKDQYVLI